MTIASESGPLVRPSQFLRLRVTPVRWSNGMTATLVLSGTVGVALTCFLVFTVWTIWLSFTDSHLLPSQHLIGFRQYARLFENDRWRTGSGNLAIYAGMLVTGCIGVGYLLAVMLDQSVRWSSLYRTILMLPLSMSLVVTGVIWEWLLNPGLGIETAVRSLGWASFTFDWLVRPDRALYTLAFVGIWQQAGMCMALFSAGLRSVDPHIWTTAKVDAIAKWKIYLHVVTPMLCGTFVTCLILLLASAIKSYDLVVVLTGGGPGFSSDLPAHFVVDLINRQELGMGAAGACLMLVPIAGLAAPLLYLTCARKRKPR